MSPNYALFYYIDIYITLFFTLCHYYSRFIKILFRNNTLYFFISCRYFYSIYHYTPNFIDTYWHITYFLQKQKINCFCTLKGQFCNIRKTFSFE